MILPGSVSTSARPLLLVDEETTRIFDVGEVVAAAAAAAAASVAAASAAAAAAAASAAAAAAAVSEPKPRRLRLGGEREGWIKETQGFRRQ